MYFWTKIHTEIHATQATREVPLGRQAEGCTACVCVCVRVCVCVSLDRQVAGCFIYVQEFFEVWVC
jgi:hypothetical protein